MNLVDFIANILFPKRCVFCDSVVSRDEDICGKCDAYKCVIGKDICYQCARDKEQCMCGDRKLYFDSCIAPFYFTDVVRNSIHTFKFRGRPDKSKGFSSLMCQCIQDKYAHLSYDCVLSVPMYYKKQIVRGYNQSELLAKNIAVVLAKPCYTDILCKVKDMTPQHELKDINRFENIADTFSISNKSLINGKNIILVDDVFTTGSTLNECAKVLKLFGAQHVYGVVIAATRK